MLETLAHGYLSESAQREVSHEYQHDWVKLVFQRSLHPCASDENSLSSGRVDIMLELFYTSKMICLNFLALNPFMPGDLLDKSYLDLSKVL